MKFLLVFAVLFIAIYVWRRNRRDELRSRPPPSRPPAVAAPKDMVRCAQCGLHLPATDAVEGRGGTYCSPAHRRLAEG